MIVHCYQPAQPPQFKDPTFSRNGTILTAANVASNGDFAEKISIYKDGELVAEGLANAGALTFDLSTLDKDYLYDFAAKVNATDEIRESKGDNLISHGVLGTPYLYVNADWLTIGGAPHATNFDVYVNGVFKMNTESRQISRTSLCGTAPYGTWTFTAIAKANSDYFWENSALSEPVTYQKNQSIGS